MTRTRPLGGPAVPDNAVELTTLARNAGWGFSAGWGREARTGLPFYRVILGRPALAGRTYVQAMITWHTSQAKGGLEIDNKLIRTSPGGTWMEMRGLGGLTNMIHAEPVTGRPCHRLA